jgi:very-short-patch-repair endonuclease
MRLDRVLLDLAAEQRSCVGIWQVRELGASRTEIDRLRRSPLWTPIGLNVLAVSGTLRDELSEVSADVLSAGPGAALSHEPGTALWGVPGFRLLPAETSQTANHARRRNALGRVHDLVVVPDRWVTSFKGIRVVRPELALYQVCARIHPDRAERAFDTAWSMGLLSGPSARACLADLRKSGKNGTTVYESILDMRGPNYVPPTNNLEGRMAQLSRQAGINLRRQVDLGGGTWDGRVDFIEDDVCLVVEVQSERYHTALCDQQADAIRRSALEADGFDVLEVWDSDVWTRGSTVVARLRQATRVAKAKRFSLSGAHNDVCA